MIPVDMDNNYGTVDIFGSWVEIGMVFLAITAGVVFGIPALFHLGKKFKKSKDEPISKTYIKKHTRINEYLTELRVKLDAARTHVVRFHNGGSYSDGPSMKKFSITHESCVDGIRETQAERQNNLLTLYSDFLDKAYLDNSKPVLTSTLTPSHFKRTLESNTVLMFSVLPLRGLKQNIVGAVVVEWCNWNKVDEIDFVKVREELTDIRRYIEAQMEAK